MTNPRGSHLVLGVALVVGGYALMLIALERQAEQAPPLAQTNDVATPPAAAGTASTAGTAVARQPGAASAQAPAASVTALPAPETSAPSPSGSAGSGVVPAAMNGVLAPADDPDAKGVYTFRFSPGGASMTKEEVQGLIALAKSLAKHKDVKVSIEGYPDRAGSEPLLVGIARHRAKVGQLLLTQAGVKEDRITGASAAELGSRADLARTIRITTTPPLSEADQP